MAFCEGPGSGSTSICSPPFPHLHSFYFVGGGVHRAVPGANGAAPDILWRAGIDWLSHSIDGPSIHHLFSPNMLTPRLGISPEFCQEKQPLFPWWPGVTILFCYDPIYFLSSINLSKCLVHGWGFLVFKAPIVIPQFFYILSHFGGTCSCLGLQLEEDRHSPFSHVVSVLEQ